MIDLFGAIQPLQQALDYHLQRHNVLASNIAHVDTPGYRPHDLARIDSSNFASVLSVHLEKTEPGHLGESNSDSLDEVGRVFEDTSAGTSADGNSVSLDRETAKLAANHVRYDVVSAVVSAELRQLSYAASDGK